MVNCYETFSLGHMLKLLTFKHLVLGSRYVRKIQLTYVGHLTKSQWFVKHHILLSLLLFQ